jgi:transcriptional regulator with XRE-family HTH domain
VEANQGLRRQRAPGAGRVRKGLTQDELAERAEIATRNLQKIEAGEINILLTTAFRIQLGLRCPWKRLMPAE